MTAVRTQRGQLDDRTLQSTYLALATDWSIWYAELDDALRRIAETLASALSVRRASVWLMQDDRGSMRCQVLFDAAEKSASGGVEFLYAEHPAYFAALRSGRLVDAHDAWTDPRTCELAQGYLRAAGVGALMDGTLRLAGETAGVLSLEHVGGPRLWTDPERRFVVSVADLVSQLLIQDRTRRSEGRYRALLDNMPSAAFRCVLEAGWTVQFISGGAAAIYGLPEAEFRGPRRSGLDTRVHPEDLPALQSALARAMADRTTVDLEYRITRCGGETRWVHEQSQASRDADTGAVVLDGVITDVTDRKRADEASRRRRDLLVHVAEGTAGATGDQFFDTLTRELAYVLGVDFVLVGEITAAREPTVRTVSAFARDAHVPDFEYPLVGTPCERVATSGICSYPTGVQAQFPDDGLLREFGIESYLGAPLRAASGDPIGILVVLHTATIPDIPFAETLLRIFAARAAAELDARRREAALRSSRTELLHQNEVLRVVNELSARLQTTTSPESIARVTVDVLVGFHEPPVVVFFLLDPDGARLRPAAHAGLDDAMLEAIRDVPLEGTLSGCALRERRVMMTHEFRDEPRILPAFRELYGSLGVQAMVALPLAHGERALGTVVLTYRGGSDFAAPALGSLESIATTVSLALSNARHVSSLEHQAFHDALTGLPNRARLHQEFDRLSPSGAARAIAPALMLLDLNRFKEINDTLGHHVGDQLLSQIGPRIAEALTAERSLVCRLGGDEFAVLLPDGENALRALESADRVVGALRRPFEVGGMRLEIGASIGVSVYPAHGPDSHQLLRSADVAMYEAKRSGAGVVVYDPAFDEHTPERLSIIQDLGEAIREQQLVLHFQPKVDLPSRTIIGFEALVRWQHPRLGLLAPGAFIPLAEVGDLMQGITRNVIELALRQLREWADAGLPYSMAINLSPRNLLERDFVASFEQALARSGADPRSVELELTETALMQDPDGAAQRLGRIAALGVRISIDDFGTGYSSLAHLRHLPIHALKIDRMFVTEMATNAQDLAIVRSTIGLGRNLGLQVVAEGVETSEVLTMLSDLGCDTSQGFAVSAPKAWRDMEAWLAADGARWVSNGLPGAAARLRANR
jgi:diguanylate cyclase (GGDEF)-like protein/PAS domain S-box-containing protein